ncbi:MAG: hypothetical protein RDU25_01895 [Patescibacteria group bacterium]|nr:hypothetical protein [Patescibacteria group bacterium]
MTDRKSSGRLGGKKPVRGNTAFQGRQCENGKRLRAKALPLGRLNTGARLMAEKNDTPTSAATEKMINDLLLELRDIDFVESLLQDAERRHWLLQALAAETIFALGFCPYAQQARRERLACALSLIKGWSFALSLDLLQELRFQKPSELLAISAMSRLLYAGYRHGALATPSLCDQVDERTIYGFDLIVPKIRRAAKMGHPVYVCGFGLDSRLKLRLKFSLAHVVCWPAQQEPAAAQIGLMVRNLAENKASCVILDHSLHPIALERLKMACELSRTPWVALTEASSGSFCGALLELEERI